LLTSQAKESGGIGGDEEVGDLGRGRACRPSPGNPGGEPQVSQDAGNHGWVVDHRNQPKSPATAGTGEDIQSQATVHQVRPEIVPAGARVTWRHRLLGGRGGVPGRPRPVLHHGLLDAVIQNQVDLRPWHQRGKALQEFYRVQDQMCGPVRPGASQRKSDLAVFGPLEAVLCHRRPQGVAGDPLQPVSLVGGHADAGMQVEASVPGLVWPEGGRCRRGGHGLTLAKPAPRAPHWRNL